MISLGNHALLAQPTDQSVIFQQYNFTHRQVALLLIFINVLSPAVKAIRGGYPQVTLPAQPFFRLLDFGDNGRSTDNVRTDRELDRSNPRLARHFDRSPLDTHVFFSIQLPLDALQRCNDFYFLCLFCCFTTAERLCMNRIGSSQIFVEHARHVARIQF